ncbi:hypothetical protein TNCV_3119661 [Trichonephila clavipes]|uniref:Uncharacterized protein n=1 Tax=Trichonephila clavipes TaxID=2585209 RepID=A0A8X6WAY6_TRICX|nr:hypothetical protein TNCV_3119661 [Trichonephila clavipes]
MKIQKDGKSRYDIARSVGRQYPSIQRVADNFKSTGIYASKPRPGHPFKLTIRERRSMIPLLKTNPCLTVLDIKKKSDPNFYDLLVLFFQSRSMISMKVSTPIPTRSF